MRVVTQVEITFCAAATSGEAADREQHESNEVRERKLEARGVAVKRNNAGMKHAGEVHASDSLEGEAEGPLRHPLDHQAHGHSARPFSLMTNIHIAC